MVSLANFTSGYITMNGGGDENVDLAGRDDRIVVWDKVLVTPAVERIWHI